MHRRVARLLGLILAASSGLVEAQSPPTLLEMVRQAAVAHPALAAQAAAIDRAQARHQQVRSRLGLTASATLSAARNDFRGEGAPRDEYGSQRHAITLRQPLFDRASRLQAESEEVRIEQARHELQAARVELAFEVVERLLDVLDADEELTAVRAEKQAVMGQRARLQRMAERQLAKVPDVMEAEAYAAALEAREVEARNALALALEALSQLCGTPLRAWRSVARDRLANAGGDLESWLRESSDRSPRLAAIRQAIEAEQRGVASARAQVLPVVSMSASKTWADSDSDSRRNPPFNVASIGVQVAIPIYESGRADGALREARAREEVARAQLEERRRETERELRSAWLKVEGARQRIAATEQAMQAREKARDAQQRGFELGTVTVVDLLETQQRLFRARADHARARHDHLRGIASLRRYAGTLDDSELARLDALFGETARTLP